MQHTYHYKKKIRSLRNRLFSSPLQPDFDILVIFSSKNIKQGHELDLTYLHPRLVM